MSTAAVWRAGALSGLVALALAGATAGRAETPPTPGLVADLGQGTRVVPANSGKITAVCKYSHTLKDDPIVAPGLPGASHSHDFAGNVSTDAFSTQKSLLTARTTCDQRKDTSAVWAPSLYADGVRVQPAAILTYYNDGFLDRLRTPPAGLRMIAGNSSSTTKQNLQIVSWACSGDPKIDGVTEPPKDCARDEALVLRINFPNCWDGKRLDSPDHKSHVAYSWVDGTKETCPRTHPVGIAALNIGVRWLPAPTGRLTLASGSIFSAHTDWWNSWQQHKLRRLVDDCIIGGRTCGSVGQG